MGDGISSPVPLPCSSAHGHHIGCTPKAVQHRVARIRKLAASAKDASADPAQTKPTARPRKRKPNAKAAGAAEWKPGRGRLEEDDDDECLEDAKPEKKIKVEDDDYKVEEDDGES
jgi:hypothetical protein